MFLVVCLCKEKDGATLWNMCPRRVVRIQGFMIVFLHVSARLHPLSNLGEVRPIGGYSENSTA